jgi:hypothetical protein
VDKQESTFAVADEQAVVIHQMRQDELRMNKWHVIHIIRQVRDEQKAFPKGDCIIATFALAVALALPLVSADFKDSLGIEKATWRAVDLILAGAFAVATVALFVWWGAMKLTRKPRSEEAIVQGIIDEMEHDRQRGITTVFTK